MNNKLILSSRNHPDTLIEQTKTKPQETLSVKWTNKWKLFHSILQ